jgi:hypothetical protein
VQGGRPGIYFLSQKSKIYTEQQRHQSASTFVQQHWFMIPGAHTRPLKSRECTYTEVSLGTLRKLLCCAMNLYTESARNGCWKWSLLCNFLLGAEEWATSLDFLWIIQSNLILCAQCTLLPLPALFLPSIQFNSIQKYFILISVEYIHFYTFKIRHRSLITYIELTWEKFMHVIKHFIQQQ